MKRAFASIAILMVLFSGERASAQLVSGGGGATGGGTTIVGGSCTNPQFIQSISTTGVPTCNTPSGAGFVAGQDLSGTLTAQTVIGIQNKAVPTPASGYLQYTGTVMQWGNPFTAGTDLSGTATSQSVIGIRSTSVPALSSGYLHYNGSVFVWDTPGGGFTAGGDLSGTSSSQSVIGIRSTSVPALSSGYLHYNGSAFVWDVPGGGFAAGGDLSGSSSTQTVIGIQTKAVPAPTSGYLHYNGSAFVFDTPSGTFTAGGDLSGTSSSQTVVGIQTKAVPAPSSGYLHYNGTTMVWDTPGSGTFAPLVNPTSGQNNYSPIDKPTLTANAGATSPIALQIINNAGNAQTTLCGIVVFPDGGYVNAGGWDVSNITIDATPGFIRVDSFNQGSDIEIQTTSTVTAIWDKNGLYKLPALQIGTAGGSPAGPGINIASGAGTYMYAGTAIGGTCTSGQFYTALSGTGAMTCAAAVTSVTAGTGLSGGTITGVGSLSLSTPVSIANGGTQTTTAPSAGQLLIAQSGTSYLPKTTSGDLTNTTAGAFTVGGIKGTSVPTLASGYLHYTGSAFAWDSPSVTVTLNTYTPTFGGFGGTAPTVTYTNQRGLYYTLGNVVHVSFYLQWSAFANGTGVVTVSLPSAQSSGGTDFIPCMDWQQVNLGTSAGVNQTYLAANANAGNSFVFFVSSGNNTTGAPAVVFNNISSSAGVLACEGWYNTGTL